MQSGPFLVGLVISTVNVSFLLRHIKYRSELCQYGYLEGNRPFKTTTPLTDAKDYRLEMVNRLQGRENKSSSDLVLYSHTITSKIRECIEKMLSAKYPWM